MQNGTVQPVYAGHANFIEQGCHSALPGDDAVRVGIEPRREHKGALVCPRMGQCEFGIVAHLITVNDEIHIQCARPPDLRPDPLDRKSVM